MFTAAGKEGWQSKIHCEVASLQRGRVVVLDKFRVFVVVMNDIEESSKFSVILHRRRCILTGLVYAYKILTVLESKVELRVIFTGWFLGKSRNWTKAINAIKEVLTLV